MITKARVKLIIEFDLADTWTPDCRVDQIFQQAGDSALGIIRNKLPPYVRVISEPEVIAILINEK